MSKTNETQKTATQYFAAWTTRDSQTMETLLDENMSFSFVTDGIFIMDGRENFVSGEACLKGSR